MKQESAAQDSAPMAATSWKESYVKKANLSEREKCRITEIMTRSWLENLPMTIPDWADADILRKR